MKKILSLLSSLVLSGAAVSTVVSCGGSGDNGTSFNFQSGPSTKKGNNSEDQNEYLDSINVGAQATYSVYNAKNGELYNPKFNGNLKNVLNTRDDNFKLTSWKNDTANFQNILYFKKDISKYKNISVNIIDNSQIQDSGKVKGEMHFEKYILSKPFDREELDGSIPHTRQYCPDAIIGNKIDNLSENVKDVFSNTKGRASFAMWNLWGVLNTTKDTQAGLHNMTMSVSFDYGDQKQITVEKPLTVDVKDKTVDLSKFDYNGDKTVDSNDNFGFSAETFPGRGLKWYKDNKYEGLDKWKVEEKMPKDNTGSSYSWTTNIKEITDTPFDKLDQVFISSHAANLSVDISGDKLSWTTNSPNLPFSALFEVKKNGSDKPVAILSVYYNEFGHQQVDNPKKNSNGDVIGPVPDYADAAKRSAIKLRDCEDEIQPLEDSNSQFVFGTGTTEQLIQYDGRLVDTYLDKKSNPEKAYDDALNKASTSVDGVKKFLTNSKDHQWTWNFDFTNLDTWMRVAADKNIPEIMINPVDKNGFGFWYLKGKEKNTGPLRYLMDKKMKGDQIQGAIWKNSGTLNKAGKQYLQTVMAPLAKQLSQHLVDISSNSAYKTKDTDQRVKVYISFDEFNEDVADRTMAIMRDNSVSNPLGKIYGSMYIGWRSNLNKIGDKTMKKDMVDGFSLNGKHYDPIDQFILVYRNFYRDSNVNSELDRFRDLVDERNAKGLRTMIYNTGGDFPGTYVQSDLSDAYWQMLFAYATHTQGWARWAYDFLEQDNYLANASATEGDTSPSSTTPSGESFFVYGGDDENGPVPSKRILALANAVRIIHKAMQLTTLDGGKYKQKINDALKSIGLSTHNIDQNNVYKWNEETDAPDEFSKIKDHSNVSTSLQADRFIALINELS